MNAELSAWVAELVIMDGKNSAAKHKVISVIRSIWLTASPGLDKEAEVLDSDNESWILSVAALSKAWETIGSSLAVSEYVRLAKCTIWTSLRTCYFHWTWDEILHRYAPKPISRDIRARFSGQLGNSLIHASRNVLLSTGTSTGSGTHSPSVLDCIAKLLYVLGEKLCTEFEPASGEVVIRGVPKSYVTWMELQEIFNAEITAVEALHAGKPTTVNPILEEPTVHGTSNIETDTEINAMLQSLSSSKREPTRRRYVPRRRGALFAPSDKGADLKQEMEVWEVLL
ncbi:hypothetical protein DFH06DRAFT_1418348 [Mycena polygramma]|nr:hypothetical protein DFH06DRAFT_1418348 [Mycena polygramma]